MDTNFSWPEYKTNRQVPTTNHDQVNKKSPSRFVVFSCFILGSLMSEYKTNRQVPTTNHDQVNKKSPSRFVVFSCFILGSLMSVPATQYQLVVLFSWFSHFTRQSPFHIHEHEHFLFIAITFRQPMLLTTYLDLVLYIAISFILYVILMFMHTLNMSFREYRRPCDQKWYTICQ